MREFNNFCVNDKTVGSVWGNVVTPDELDALPNKVIIRFKQTLHEYNGKVYLFFRDHELLDNYFVEVGGDTE